MARRRRKAETRCRYFVRDEAAKRGWDTRHVADGGDVLEENEIAAHFPLIGLGGDKPDFLFCLAGEPVVAVEAKNESGKLDVAVAQAIGYAEAIRAGGRHVVDIVVGAAGEPESGVLLEVRFFDGTDWIPLEAHGFPLTTIPSAREVELALAAGNGTTVVSVPASSEFVDAAIELSTILRTAKIEAPLRPKVIGAVVVAMYQGEVDLDPDTTLSSVNRLTESAISQTDDLPAQTKDQLIDALRLSSADFDRLAPSIRRVVAILRRLNVRSVLQTDTDFLGLFYEAFLRYGYDNNALGIVFTPRHVTRFCVELLEPDARDRVIDIASGTGGFLVAAFDAMIGTAASPKARTKVKESIAGFETNPTVWALSVLNMFFRGDGKSNIKLASCFAPDSREEVSGKFTMGFLNPPFSQDEEPECDFLDAAMDALEPDGELASIVYAGVFADDHHREWRKGFLARHTLIAMISMPEDLFYPTAAPTTIMVARAHRPQDPEAKVMMARVWNDGFAKLKSRRVEVPGSQLPEIRAQFRACQAGEGTDSALAIEISASDLLDGREWSPQQWLPQPAADADDIAAANASTLRAIFQAVAHYPELADQALDEFAGHWSELPPLPTATRRPLDFFFEVENGSSSGEKNYRDGAVPYVSSGDASNSIVRLVEGVDPETFGAGGLTVTAFGTASIQPWPFMGRGNGGSAVRVLLPRYDMSVNELIWFATQINLQRWRFFYARMSIKSRISKLVVESPPERLPDGGTTLAERLREFRDTLNRLARVG
jgi:hypothetical protein